MDAMDDEKRAGGECRADQEKRLLGLEEAIVSQREILRQIRDFHMPWLGSEWKTKMRKRLIVPMVKIGAAVSVGVAAFKGGGLYLQNRKISTMAERYAQVANRLFYEEDNPEVALEFLDKATDLRPESAEYRFARAVMSGSSVARRLRGLTRPLTRQELDAAHRAYAEAVFLQQLEPGRFEPYVLQAKVLTALKEYDKADRAVALALERAPDNVFLQLSCAELFYRSGRLPAFEKALGRAAARAPRSRQVLFWQGVLAQEVRKDNATARKLYEEVLAQDPKNGRALCNLAWTWVRAKDRDFAKARELMQQAVAADPHDKEACYSLGKLYYLEKNCRIALAWLDKAVRLDANYLEALMWRGIVRAETGDDEGAKADFNEAVLLDPMNEDLYFRRAMVYRRHGQLAEAALDLDFVLELNPDHDRARTARARLADARGDHVAGAETWRMTELAFESSGAAGEEVELDVVFALGENRLRIPAFWDGGRSYKVRFAPPQEGVWTWRTECAGEKSLNGLAGSLRAVRYSGPLEVYRRGFVSAVPGRKYLAYADGTPFLYLGDTHWGFGREAEDDAAHPDEHHVETVAKRRVEQGFTVWQSEPLGCSFDLADGHVDEQDIAGFRVFDRAFQTVADHGFVHANAQFFFPRAMRKPLSTDEKALRRLSRYWVARYGAYPVMWTLGQEVDNDFYYGKDHGQKEWTATENPYVRIASFIHSFDAYAHPLTAHQESTWDVSATGRGTGAASSTNDLTRGRSAFADPASAKTCGHNWWGVQWSPRLDNGPQRFEVLRDFWEDPRPAVNYEGRYCGLWALDFGARAQVWISFLSGFCGQGYGAADLWLFKSTYDMAKPSKNEVEEISLEVKHTPWRKALEFESANQMPHFRKFMAEMDWWKLKPDIGEERRFRPASSVGGASACAADGDGLAVVYIYDRTSSAAGRLCGLAANATYCIERFNPRTGEAVATVSLPASAKGEIDLPDRPDCGDWVYRLRQP